MVLGFSLELRDGSFGLGHGHGISIIIVHR